MIRQPLLGQGALPWTSKHRPVLKDLVCRHSKTIIQLCATEKDIANMPHLLFYGPPGTGKTTAAQDVARRIYGPEWSKYTRSVNASHDRTVDFMRQLCTSLRTCPKSGPYNLLILDEADKLTDSAMQMMKRGLLEKSNQQVRVIIICNIVSALIPPIVSRCAKFDFSLPDVGESVKRLAKILDLEEQPQLDPLDLQYLVECSDHDLRSAVCTLQNFCCINPSSDIRSVIDELSNRVATNKIDNLWKLVTEPGDAGISLYNKLRDEDGYSNKSIFFQIVEKFLANPPTKGDLCAIGNLISETEELLHNSVQFDNMYALPRLFLAINRQCIQ